MREKLIELLMDKPFGRATEEEETAHIEDVADYLIANGVTFATDNNVGHWITKNGCTFCSECMTCGSPQWKVCPVCETKMVGDELSPTAYNVSATEPKWIPVTERLPEGGKKVLATKMGANGMFVFYGKQSHGTWLDLEWSCYRYGVTHWMMLPEPPKGE